MYPADNDFDPSDRPRRRFRLRFVSLLKYGIGALLIIGLCVGILLLVNQLLGGLGVINRLAYTPGVIVKDLIDAQELATVKTNSQQITTAEQTCEIAGVQIGSKKMLYVAYGIVSAGIDFKELKPEDITVSGDQVTIQLPAPRILDSYIDVNRSYVYDYQDHYIIVATALVCPDQPTQADMQTWAERQSLVNVVSAACETGVLDEANARAKLAVTQLLQMVKFVVEVKTRPPAPCPTPQPTP